MDHKTCKCVYLAKFSIYDKNIDSLKFFFDNEINKKKLTILNSKIFFKDNSDDIYSILNINKSVSYLETETNLNHLRLNGDIFNNPIVLKIKNSTHNAILIKYLLSIQYQMHQAPISHYFNSLVHNMLVVVGGQSWSPDLEYFSKFSPLL